MSDTEERRPASSAGSVVAAERARRLASSSGCASAASSPTRSGSTATTASARSASSSATLAPGEEAATTVRIAGRAMLIRRHGGLVFADLRDQTGKVQLLASRDDLGAEAFADVSRARPRRLDRRQPARRCDRAGRAVGARERESSCCRKTLRALPDKHRGLTDVDTRLRERYLDLIVNPSRGGSSTSAPR